MTICTCNVRKTPKTDMNPYISWLVSIYGIRWNIYHMLLVKLRNFIATKYPFWAKMGVKITICTCNVRKTPKTHMKPYISRLVSIYRMEYVFISKAIYAHVMTLLVLAGQKFASLSRNTLFGLVSKCIGYQMLFVLFYARNSLFGP